VRGFLGFEHGGLVGAAAGGRVTGGTPGVDSVPILAQAGELIVPRRLATDLLSFMGGLQPRGGNTFADGGLVGDVGFASGGGVNVTMVLQGPNDGDTIREFVNSPAFGEAITEAVKQGTVFNPASFDE